MNSRFQRFFVLLPMAAILVAYVAAYYIWPLDYVSTSGIFGIGAGRFRIFDPVLFLLVCAIGLQAGTVLLFLNRRIMPALVWGIAHLLLALIFYFDQEWFKGTVGNQEIFGVSLVYAPAIPLPWFLCSYSATVLLLMVFCQQWTARRPFFSKQSGLLLLAVLSFVLYVIGMHLPLFTSTQFLVLNQEVSLTDSIATFFQSGEWFIGMIILVFTVLFPLLKFAAILLVLTENKAMAVKKWQQYLSVISKWSMLDVFVVALLLLNLKMDSRLLDMEIRSGVVVFAISILITTGLGMWYSRQASHRDAN